MACRPQGDVIETCGQGTLLEARPRLSDTVREVADITLPCIAGFLLTLINQLTNTVVIGHTGNQTALAALGLANMMQNCLGLYVGIGIAGALDTLVSQAHGSREYEISCHYLQRCRMLITLQLVWMIPILWYSDPLLRLIRQEAAIARDAADYTQASVLGLFAAFQFEITRRFLQNRGNARPAAVICVVTSVAHVGWCLLFVVHLRLGNAGAGYANAVTWWSQFALGSLYLGACEAPHGGLRKWSVLGIERAAFHDCWTFLRVAIPATAQFCSEWWFWDLCSLSVGYLGDVALAAHVAAMNWVMLCCMPVIGLNASTATLVGNALGANQPGKAQYVAWTCIWVNVVSWAVIAAVTLAFRGPLARIYCSDGDVRGLIEQLITIYAVAGFFDTTQNLMGGALRGMGWNRLAAVTYILAYYVVMFPGGCVAAFSLRMGVRGIWYFFGVGTSIVGLVFGLALYRADFHRLAAEATVRTMRERELAAVSARTGKRLQTPLLVRLNAGHGLLSANA